MENEKEIQLTDEEILKEYISDPTKKELHVKIAQMLEEQFKDKWFSVKDINRKTAIKSFKEASQMVFGLDLFGLVVSKRRKKEKQYKIILSNDQKIKVLEERRETHIEQIAILDEEIEKLKTTEVSN